jgi:hypothetical protein
MKYGFIYIIFRAIINLIRYLSLVELFKFIGLKLNPRPHDENYCKAYSRTFVDIFVVLKWVLVIILFLRGTNNIWWVWVMWYLIITNIHTYFYYHVWRESAINSSDKDEHSLRRRFIYLLLAISFSNFCFAYLYFTSYSTALTWGEDGPKRLHAIWYSISNSVAANYSVVSCKLDSANSIAMIQLLITFVFVTIIISRSIPEKT